MPPPLELTLVVAATRKMGIGKGGTLPWTGLRKEMAYFARVTKRVSTSVSVMCTQAYLVSVHLLPGSISVRFYNTSPGRRTPTSQ